MRSKNRIFRSSCPEIIKFYVGWDTTLYKINTKLIIWLLISLTTLIIDIFIKFKKRFLLPNFCIKHNKMLRIYIPWYEMIHLIINPINRSWCIKELRVLHFEPISCFSYAIYHWGVRVLFIFFVYLNTPQFNFSICTWRQEFLFDRMVL